MNISFKEIEIHWTKIMQTYTGNIYEDRNIYGKKFFCHIYSYKILTKII